VSRLVGSEMCIRDRASAIRASVLGDEPTARQILRNISAPIYIEN
jgi:hypothetical protein